MREGKSLIGINAVVREWDILSVKWWLANGTEQ